MSYIKENLRNASKQLIGKNLYDLLIRDCFYKYSFEEAKKLKLSVSYFLPNFRNYALDTIVLEKLNSNGIIRYGDLLNINPILLKKILNAEELESVVSSCIPFLDNMLDDYEIRKSVTRHLILDELLSTNKKETKEENIRKEIEIQLEKGHIANFFLQYLDKLSRVYYIGNNRILIFRYLFSTLEIEDQNSLRFLLDFVNVLDNGPYFYFKCRTPTEEEICLENKHINEYFEKIAESISKFQSSSKAILINKLNLIAKLYEQNIFDKDMTHKILGDKLFEYLNNYYKSIEHAELILKEDENKQASSNINETNSIFDLLNNENTIAPTIDNNVKDVTADSFSNIELKEDEISAKYHGSSNYTVKLIKNGNAIVGSCTCPSFTMRNASTCKHINGLFKYIKSGMISMPQDKYNIEKDMPKSKNQDKIDINIDNFYLFDETFYETLNQCENSDNYVTICAAFGEKKIKKRLNTNLKIKVGDIVFSNTIYQGIPGYVYDIKTKMYYSCHDNVFKAFKCNKK